MININKIYEVTIKQYDEYFQGIAFVGKDKVIVPQALKNENCKVKIVKKIQQGYIGEIIKIKQMNKQRGKVNCAIYKKCGGCHLLHVKDEEQMTLKSEKIISLLQRSKVNHLQLKDIWQANKMQHYRNKVIIGFQKNHGKIEAGLYEEFSHRIVPYTSCLMHDETSDAIVKEICQWMNVARIAPYDPYTRRGFLRNVLIRKAEATNEMMVVFVTNTLTFPARKQLIQQLLKKFPQITSMIQNVNTRKTSIVLGDKEQIMYGKGYIEDVLCGYTFRLSSKSFYQIHHDQTEVLYQKAISLLQFSGSETLLDAYCGIGTIGVYASAFAHKVIGVELNKDAIKDAKENAKINKINHIDFVCDDATNYMMQLAKQKKNIDIVVLDPPRSGTTKECIQALAKLKPKQILYISCDPTTQIRDLEIFKQYRYEAKDMYISDQFPNSFHVESVVVLTPVR